MRILVIGGSGFLSGAIARAGVRRGATVACVTRGKRPLPEGVTGFTADRHDQAMFRDAVKAARRAAGGRFDLVVDAIPFTPEDARQDLELFSHQTDSLMFISTDFVYDPAHRRFPQAENPADYLTEGYGGRKRAAEEVLLNAGSGELPWTVLRPGHIYGPGSLPGCLPPLGRDDRLLERLANGERIPLVGAGRFLQQPIFVDDLARLVLDLAGKPAAAGEIFNAAGPEIVESVTYYEIIASLVGAALQVEEVPVEAFLAEHPGRASFLCHRFYDLTRLESAGVALPATSLRDGLDRHIASLRP